MQNIGHQYFCPKMFPSILIMEIIFDIRPNLPKSHEVGQRFWEVVKPWKDVDKCHVTLIV